MCTEYVQIVRTMGRTEVTHVLVFRDDGLIARLDECDTLEEGLEAAGGGL